VVAVAAVVAARGRAAFRYYPSTVAACRSCSCALPPPPPKAGEQRRRRRSRVDDAIADVCIDCGNGDERYDVVLPCFGSFHLHPVVVGNGRISVGAAPFKSLGGTESRRRCHCAARPL
jgi:hypothetical protein